MFQGKPWLQHYLLNKPEASEDFPFGPDAAVYKVHGKMFALVFQRQQQLLAINLKCDPLEAQQLRDVFSAVTPGYHMNKRHWNTVLLDGTVPGGEIERMVDHSFRLVVEGLPKKQRRALEIAFGPEAVYRDLPAGGA